MGEKRVLDEVRAIVFGDETNTSTLLTEGSKPDVSREQPEEKQTSVRSLVQKLISGVDAHIEYLKGLREGLETLDSVLMEGGDPDEDVSEESGTRSGEATGSDPVRPEHRPEG